MKDETLLVFSILGAHPQGKWPTPDDGMPGNVYAANFALQALFSYAPDRGSTARPAATLFLCFRGSVCAAPALNAAGQSRVKT